MEFVDNVLAPWMAMELKALCHGRHYARWPPLRSAHKQTSSTERKLWPCRDGALPHVFVQLSEGTRIDLIELAPALRGDVLRFVGRMECDRDG